MGAGHLRVTWGVHFKDPLVMFRPMLGMGGGGSSAGDVGRPL